MTRTVSTLLLVVGLLLCTMGGRGAGRTPPFRDGYWILAADFHIHGFPGDGVLAPDAILREARRRNLDVIGISDHNQMLPARFGGRTAAVPGGVLAIAADEVTTRGAHIVAVGISTPVDWRPPAVSIIDAIHAQRGVAIAAHPSRRRAGGLDRAAVLKLDGFEAAHPEMHVYTTAGAEIREFGDWARELKPAIGVMGASDFHYFQPIGVCRTYLLARELNEASVLEAIRSGRTIGCDARGNAYGNPEYVRLAGDDCRSQAVARPPHAWLNVSGTACAWLGLLILAFSGRGTAVAPKGASGGHGPSRSGRHIRQR